LITIGACAVAATGATKIEAAAAARSHLRIDVFLQLVDKAGFSLVFLPVRVALNRFPGK
jgi:hypothetical protein